MRFIEFMPLDAGHVWRREDILTGAEVRAIIEAAVMPLVPIAPDRPSATASRFRFADGVGEVGFINPISQPFCSSCDRIRLTAEGQLRTCLFSHVETNLRTILRSGGSDEDLAATLRHAVLGKEMKHHINDTSFRRTERSMSQIGG